MSVCLDSFLPRLFSMQIASFLHIKRNFGLRSRSHCCRGKAINIKLNIMGLCLFFLALVILRVNCIFLHRIALSLLTYLPLPPFST